MEVGGRHAPAAFTSGKEPVPILQGHVHYGNLILRVVDWIVTILFGYILYCVCFNLYCVCFNLYFGCFNMFCNVWVCVCVGFVMCGFVYVWVLKCVGVLVICVLVFTVFCVVCIVSFTYVYSYLFCLY